MIHIFYRSLKSVVLARTVVCEITSLIRSGSSIQVSIGSGSRLPPISLLHSYSLMGRVTAGLVFPLTDNFINVAF
jgi:hypothetical protein